MIDAPKPGAEAINWNWPAGTQQLAQASQPAAHTQPMTLLVIDDEPGVRSVIERMLRFLGARVLSAASGAQGIALFREAALSIGGVLLDASMPTMDGAATLAELQALNPEVRVVLMSGYSRHQLGPWADSDAVCGFLAKPFAIQDLAATLQALRQEA